MGSTSGCKTQLDMWGHWPCWALLDKMCWSACFIYFCTGKLFYMKAWKIERSQSALFVTWNNTSICLAVFTRKWKHKEQSTLNKETKRLIFLLFIVSHCGPLVVHIETPGLHEPDLL